MCSIGVPVSQLRFIPPVFIFLHCHSLCSIKSNVGKKLVKLCQLDWVDEGLFLSIGILNTSLKLYIRWSLDFHIFSKCVRNHRFWLRGVYPLTLKKNIVFSTWISMFILDS